MAEWMGGGAATSIRSPDAATAPGGAAVGRAEGRTTNMRPAWLRPKRRALQRADAVVTEHFTRFTHPQAGDWFVVTTTVEDPTYLTQPFTTSTNFKKEPNESKWSPAACKG